MQLCKCSDIYQAVSMVCCVTAAIGVIPLHTVSAQDGEWPSNAEAYPGQIVYARDVPFGSATRRFDQAEASTVSPDQSALISQSLLIGLEPLSDAEQALVAAPLSQAHDTTRSALQTGLSALSQSHSSEGDFTRSESGSPHVGGIIGNSLGALSRSLGVIGKVLGDGQ